MLGCRGSEAHNSNSGINSPNRPSVLNESLYINLIASPRLKNGCCSGIPLNWALTIAQEWPAVTIPSLLKSKAWVHARVATNRVSKWPGSPPAHETQRVMRCVLLWIRGSDSMATQRHTSNSALARPVKESWDTGHMTRTAAGMRTMAQVNRNKTRA